SCPSSWLSFPSSLCYAVERYAEREDRERRHDALAELIPLQAAGNLVAERAGAHQTADHHHGQNHDQALVHAEHDAVARERDPHLAEDLHARRAERVRGLDRAL